MKLIPVKTIKSLNGYHYKNLTVVELGKIISVDPIWDDVRFKTALLGYKLTLESGMVVNVSVYYRLRNYVSGSHYLRLIATHRGDTFYAAGIRLLDPDTVSNWSCACWDPFDQYKTKP